MTFPLSRATALWTMIALAFLITACSNGSQAQNVSVQELKAKLAREKAPIVVDVRTPAELTGPLGAIEGVINIPLQELDRRLAELAAHKTKDIYVICRTGNRSGSATTLLREKGYKAYNVSGGMVAWRNAFATDAK